MAIRAPDGANKTTSIKCRTYFHYHLSFWKILCFHFLFIMWCLFDLLILWSTAPSATQSTRQSTACATNTSEDKKTYHNRNGTVDLYEICVWHSLLLFSSECKTNRYLFERFLRRLAGTVTEEKSNTKFLIQQTSVHYPIYQTSLACTDLNKQTIKSVSYLSISILLIFNLIFRSFMNLAIVISFFQ